MTKLQKCLNSFVVTSQLATCRLRAHYWSLRGAHVGHKCLLGSRVRMDLPWLVRLGTRCVLESDVWLKVVDPEATLVLGDHVFVGRHSQIDVSCSVTIGSHVLIAPGVFITDHNHGILPGRRIADQGCPSNPVAVGDDVWLGTGAVILPGVSIGTGAVVGAQAVVTGDIEPGSIVAGVPAREIGFRQERSGVSG